MNLAKTIEELLDNDDMILWAKSWEGCELQDWERVCEAGDLKRLVATLRKCETAIDSLDGMRMDELLSEIREVLDGKGN